MAQKTIHSMSECITNCADCHRVSLETITHCLTTGGKHVEATHLQLLMDCAAICQTCDDFMTRGSARHAQVCEVCASICTACAASCDTFGDDPIMKACAEACRKCAVSCGEMGKTAATAKA